MYKYTKRSRLLNLVKHTRRLKKFIGVDNFVILEEIIEILSIEILYDNVKVYNNCAAFDENSTQIFIKHHMYCDFKYGNLQRYF